MAHVLPVVGDWYRQSGGALFEVVAIDDSDSTVEVQHDDGTVEEIDLENWEDMLIEAAQPPEDWAGSFDIDRDDYPVDLDESHREYMSPLDFFDQNE